MLQSRKHLVLGSRGQLGGHLMDFLARASEEASAFDILDGEHYDLRTRGNTALAERLAEADFVYFLAFDVGGARYLKKYQDTFEFIDNNARLMSAAFDALRRSGAPFIFASSQMSNMISSPYGLLKSIGERYTSALGGLSVRLWNVYGYEADLDKSHVITDFILKAQHHGAIEMLTDGSEQRQFLFAEDFCDCMLRLSRLYGQIPRDAPLHVSSFEWTDVYSIAQIVSELVGGADIIRGRGGDTVQADARNQPDPWILQHWRPSTTLRDGIRQLVDAYAARPPLNLTTRARRGFV